MKRKLLSNSAFLLLLALIFTQCSDPHARYDDPPWLGGTNIETLEELGEYSEFLALMDKAEYRVSLENQLFTLFVPSDAAFQEYFQSIGLSSVDDLSIQQAEELFGQHILINPRSRDQLIYEYAWDELQDPRGEYGALFHRKQTYSVPLDYLEEVKYNEEFLDQTIRVYRDRTLVPLWTEEYFEDYFGDAKSDYERLYPGSQYIDSTKMAWHDAAVTDAEVRTSSGFIYFLDKVVAPMPTIDLFMLRKQEDFGLFYDLTQRFATYGAPRVNEQLERRYRKAYDQISNLAQEQGPDPGAPQNMLYMYSAFVPTNDVLQEFLDNTVLQYYEDIDSVPELFIVYLLQSHILNRLTLPSKMEGNFQNFYGDKIDVDINSDIETIDMCSNGALFTMKRVLEPNAFTCAPGPVFYNSNYTTFLYALQYSELLSTLTKPNINVTVFAADNDLMEEYGIRQNDLDGDVVLQIRLLDGTWTNMEQVDIEEFIEDYVHVGDLDEYSGEGFLRMASDNYVYYNSEKFAAGGNQINAEECDAIEIINSNKNGNLVYLDKAIKRPYNVSEYVLNDPDLSSFADLLIEAALIDSAQIRWEKPDVKRPRIAFLTELFQWTIFAPTNQAIADADALGLIPDAAANDGLDLRRFLQYHFVRGKSVFDDGILSGTFQTNRDTTVSSNLVYMTLDISNSPNNLSIEDISGNVVNVNHADANKLVESGVLHKINSVLKIED